MKTYLVTVRAECVAEASVWANNPQEARELARVAHKLTVVDGKAPPAWLVSPWEPVKVTGIVGKAREVA